MTPLHKRAVGVLLLSLVPMLGCGRPAASPSAAVKAPPTPGEGLAETVSEAFRKSGDAKAYRQLVDHLNVVLSRGDVERKPEALSDAQRTLLQKEFALNEPELAEAARREYTPLDAYYIDETALYRDIARALDAGTLKPAEKARAALNWIVVNLRPVEVPGPALPPWFTAMRGAGTTLERTYALLRLLHQLDLDVCLIGDESAAGSTTDFWAVGVLTGDQIYLFDVRLGLPVPGPGGDGIATLAQVRGDAKAFQPLAVDPKLSYDVTPERAKNSHLYVTAPLSALSPRMKFLQGLVPANTVKLDYDLTAVRDRFRGVVAGPAYAGCTVRLWNPPAPDTLPRALMAFLPASEGGTDRAPPQEQRYNHYFLAAVPWQMLPPIILRDLPGEPGERLRVLFHDRMMLLSQPGHARELILRGLFDEATTKLIELQQRFNARPLPQREVEDGLVRWVNAAREVYAGLARAERDAQKNPAAIAEREKRKEEIGNLWRNANGVVLYMDYLVSEPLLAEITYLLAICKHEEALRRTYRGEEDKAAWKTAERWWEKFIHTYGSSPAVATARRHHARTLEGSGRPAEGKAAYQAVAASDRPTLERLAAAYLASRVK